MEEPTEVWCWARGTSCSKVFCVEVSPDITLRALQQQILASCPGQATQAYGGVPDLYRVPQTHPVDLQSDQFQDVLGALCISKLGAPLRITRTRTLADISAGLKPDHLHFIVGSFPFNLWFRGGRSDDYITIRLPGEEDLLSALRSKAKESWPPLKNVPTMDLKLYKISFKDIKELKENLDAMGEGRLISLKQKVFDIFCDIPFSSDSLDVVIEVATSLKSSILPPSRQAHASGKNMPNVTVEGERTKFLNDNKVQRPSLTAAPSTFQKRQANPAQAIPCGRPREYEDCIPVTLLHPVFAQFKQDIRDIPLTAEDDAFAVDFASAMSNIYSEESQRAEKIRSAFKTYDIHFNVSRTQPGKYEPDGDMSIKGYRYAMVEFKNEVGSTSAEPYFQIIGYYLEFTRADATKMSHSPLPCLLLSIFGPYIDFSGAAWNHRPVVQSLSRVAFHIHSTDTEDLVALVRHLAAFRKATQLLKEYYDELQPPSLSRSPSSQLFPYPTTYNSLITDTKVEIIYRKQVSTKQLVFFGIEGTDERTPICIKFVRRYSRDAHEYCASLGCAPTLRGFETIQGGWYMVVMDDISDEYRTIFDRPASETTKKLIADKLLAFHTAGFVHGDLRDTNIMVSKSDRKDFKFIDFDWAGKADETTLYPPFVNREFWRPPDASDWLPIREEHDFDMLGHIEGWVPDT